MSKKVAMITGASVGIGRAVALRMASEKIDLVLVDINETALNKVVEEVTALGVKALAFVADVSNEERVNEVVKEANKEFGKIDILVNNAAIWRCFDSFINLETEKWRKIIDVNVLGAVYCIKAVLPKMIENKYGRIVNVASVAGVYGNAGMSAYSATKGALIAMTKALSKEVISDGIIVNSVAPGLVSPSDNEDIDYFELSDRCYAGRTGTDRENANAIYFLCSDEVGYIVGQNIQVDGCRRML